MDIAKSYIISTYVPDVFVEWSTDEYGTLSSESYEDYQNTVVISETPISKVITLTFERNSFIHRDDGPAYLIFDSSGKLLHSFFYRNEQLVVQPEKLTIGKNTKNGT